GRRAGSESRLQPGTKKRKKAAPFKRELLPPESGTPAPQTCALHSCFLDVAYYPVPLMKRLCVVQLLGFGVWLFVAPVSSLVKCAKRAPGPGPYPPPVQPASAEAELASKRFRLPKGLKVELAAAEPLLANPVAFTIDEHGRFFVVETFRLHSG